MRDRGQRGFALCVALLASLAFVASSAMAQDADGDGVPDSEDNCPTLHNPNQDGGTPIRITEPIVPRRISELQQTADGSTMVYLAYNQGGTPFGLYSVPVAGGTVATLTTDPPLGGSGIIWSISPDSAHVVYRAAQDTADIPEVYSVPIAGGPVTKLNLPGDWVFDYVISPDGKRVIYRNSRDDLFSVPTAGGPVTKLYSDLVQADVFFEYAVSPDSSTVIFTGLDTNNHRDLYNVPIGGGTLTKISPPSTSVGTFWQITPDGTKVVFRNSTARELSSVPIGGGAATTLVPTLPVARIVASFRISPDSDWIVYRSDQGDTDNVFELYSVPIEGGKVTKLNPPFTPGGSMTGFLIGPDSEWVMYLADQETDTVQEVYSVPIGGGTATKIHPTLTAGFQRIEAPWFSSDGSRAMFIAELETAGVRDLYSSPIAGGVATKLNGPLAGSGFHRVTGRSCPGGEVIYLADQDIYGVDELFAVPIDGGTPLRLHPPLSCCHSVWAFWGGPDCRLVVYVDEDSYEVDDLYTTAMPTDIDGDGILRTCDVCPATFNPAQGDQDGDGVGTLCDNCPSSSNSGQTDADADGAGDVCDCRADDGNDRRPGEVPGLAVSRAGTVTTLSWSPVPGADVYAIMRGTLDALGSRYGACLIDGLTGTSYSDSADPAPGAGYAYLIQGQSFDCGPGTLGYTSAEQERDPGSGACVGVGATAAHAAAEAGLRVIGRPSGG